MESTCICGVIDDPEKGQWHHHHHPTVGMTFSRALFWLKKGQKVRRSSWGPALGSVFLSNTQPIFCMKWPESTPSNVSHPELVENYPMLHTDLLAEDWELV